MSAGRRFLLVLALLGAGAAPAEPVWLLPLGVQVTEIPPTAYDELGVDHGVRVLEVLIGSPAAGAGLREGDLLTDLAGANVTSIARLRYLLDQVADEQVVSLEIQRNGQILSRDVRLRPPERSPGIG